MRDIMIPVAICVVAIGGIAIWLLNIKPTRSIPEPIVEVQHADDKTNAGAPKKPKAPSKPSAPAPVVEEVALATPLAPAPKAPVKAAEPRQFPVANLVAIGAEKTSLTAKFGEPTLTATSTAGGHLQETLIYARDEGRRSTIIHLLDGKINSVF